MKNVKASNEEIEYWIGRMQDYHAGKQPEVCTEVYKLLELYIHSLAYQFKGLEHEDLFAIGVLAVVENISNYDPANQRILPITYFRRHIYGSMYKAVAEARGLSKNDTSIGKLIQNAITELEENNAEVSISNIVRQIGRPRITEEVVYNNLRAVRHSLNHISLNKVLDEGNATVMDMVTQSTAVSPEEAYEKTEKEDLIKAALSRLDDLEAKVIRLCELEERSIAETARVLQLTTTNVKKYRTSAFIKLHNDFELNRYMQRASGNEFDFCECNLSKDISFRNAGKTDEDIILIL